MGSAFAASGCDVMGAPSADNRRVADSPNLGAPWVAEAWVGGASGLAEALRSGAEPLPHVARVDGNEPLDESAWLAGWLAPTDAQSRALAVANPDGPVRVESCYWSTVITYECGFWDSLVCSYTLCLQDQEWWDFCHDADRDGYANNADRIPSVPRYFERDGLFRENWTWRYLHDATDEYGSCDGPTDCADGNPHINPGANEACDPVDQDCDGNGFTDSDSERFTYAVGEPCSTGEAGRCSAGVVACAGQWASYCAQMHAPIEETCNLIDDDCNGLVDDGRARAVYFDSDGDGYGTWGTTLDSICPTAWYWADEGGDCDDGTPSTSPGAADVCNGVDDDCNSATGDGAGDPDVLFARSCETGEFGRCSAGTWQCGAGTKSCVQSEAAGMESCSNPGVDDDCNGEVDDIWSLGEFCDSDDSDLCDDDVFGCSGSILVCLDSTAGDAERVELCDGVDNDCNPATADGAADDRIGGSCDSPDDVDLCLDDVQACGDAGIICVNSTAGDAARVEVCDGEDNDCDGTADEGPERIYFWDADRDGVGADRIEWTSVCPPEDPRNVVEGGDCDDRNPGIYPGATELCDGVDNDCAPLTADGVDDERVGIEGAELAYPGPEHCQASVSACSQGQVVAEPRPSDGSRFGEVETVSVSAGLLASDSGELAAGWHLMTADDRHAYSLAYDIEESAPGGFHGWRYVVYDPRRDWAIVEDRTVPTTSYLAAGVASDGTFLYPIGDAAPWDVDRIRIADGQLLDGGMAYTDTDGDGSPDCDVCDVAGAQMDPLTGLTLASRTGGAEIQFYSGLPWLPPAGLVSETTIPDVPAASWEAGVAPGVGLGVVGTDGTYGFARVAGDHAGPREIVRFGTGTNGTSRASFEGVITNGSSTRTISGFEFDGWFYEAGDADSTLLRTRVSPALTETCDGTDNNCNGVVDDEGARGCINYWFDQDGDDWGVPGPGRCMCAPDGFYRATRVGDCDDVDPLRNPGQDEGAGDGVDSNCDGLERCYQDADRDGWRSDRTELSAEMTCPIAAGLSLHTDGALDCDDSNSLISPDASETCDSRDNDCNGTVDDGFETVGDACDAADDSNSCLNGTVICSDDEVSVECSGGAIAAYDFDESFGTVAFDAASPATSLALVNGAGFGDGVVGSALSLDGTDDHVLGTGFGSWAGSDLSIAFWAAPSGEGEIGVLVSSAAIGGPEGCCARWAIRHDPDGHVALFVDDGEDREVRSELPIEVDAWAHVGASIDRFGYAQLFIDGVWQGATSVGEVDAWGYPVVGASLWTGAVTDAFAGRIDELLILPGALGEPTFESLSDQRSTPQRHRVVERCDGIDNDCNDVVDDDYSVGVACDGDDLDGCQDDVSRCSLDRQSTECRFGGARVSIDFESVREATVFNVAGAAFGESGNLTLVGGAGLAPGIRGSALQASVDGAAGSVADGALTRVDGHALTTGAWVRPVSFPATGERAVVVEKNGSFGLSLDDAGAARCAVVTEFGLAEAVSTALPTDEWSHVGCTYGRDGGVRVYIDGILSGGPSFTSGRVAVAASEMLVGSDGVGSTFDGAIDDVVLFEFELNAVELLRVSDDVGAVVIGADDRGDNRELCDGADNNCNVTIDETFEYVDPQGLAGGLGAPCDGADAGACVEGEVVCSADGLAAICTDETEDELEICNDGDDDCDGLADEDLPFVSYFRDSDGDSFGTAGETFDACEHPGAGWVTDSSDCADSDAGIAPGAAEVCDAIDNDCNGAVDDGELPEEGAECAADALGVCADGTVECAAAESVTRPLSDDEHGDGWLDAWLVYGPFLWIPASDDACSAQPPIETVAPDLMPRAGDTTGARTWTEQRGLETTSFCNDGFGLALSRLFPGDPTFGYYYAATYVHSPVARAVDLAVGYDDNIRIWVNGTLVHSGITCTCFSDDEVLVPAVTLEAGQNTILVQSGNVGGDAGFLMRFLSPERAGTDGCEAQSPSGQCPVTDLWIATEPSLGTTFCQAAEPAETEDTCNGLDDDCDGVLAATEIDHDDDGQWECLGDCAPEDPTRFLGADELCNWLDDDCDGVVDNGLGVGSACEGDDADLCLDGVTVCSDGAAFCASAAAIYEFEGSTPTFDRSGNGHLAVLEGDASAGPEGPSSAGALALAGGASALRIPSSALVESDAYTLAAWVLPTSAGPRALFGATGASIDSLLVGTSEWLLLDGVTYDRGPALDIDRWTHVAVTHEAGALRVFHDAVEVAGPHVISTSPTNSLTSDLFIGQRLSASTELRTGCPDGCSFEPGSAFEGLVDDVVVYGYALDAAALTELLVSVPARDRNAELCDGRDNDCDGTVDAEYTFGACEGPDADNCFDSRIVCAVDGLDSECGDGASVIVDFDRTAADDSSCFLNLAGGLCAPHSVTTETVDGRLAAAFTGDGALVRTLGGPRASFGLSLWARTSDAEESGVLASRANREGQPFHIAANGELAWMGETWAVAALDSALDAGAWAHVAISFDGATVRVFVDGAEVEVTVDGVGSLSVDVQHLTSPEWTGDWVVGATDGDGAIARPFVGWIDDLTVMDFSLSVGDVSTLFGPGLPALMINYELCDGLDNDCSGTADEMFTTLDDPCSSGLGECFEEGVLVCSADQVTTACSAEGLEEVAELCNGLDDDCDGEVDEALRRGCSTACGLGSETCSVGLWVGCDAPMPEPERCDEIDHDCVDGPMNGFELGDPCTSGLGECAAPGFAFCAEDGTLGCDGIPLPAGAERCDALDHDCDGEATNGFGVGEACFSGLGVCAVAGTRICAGDGTAVCDSTALPPTSEEICGNGDDDDCDGLVDETGGVIAVSLVQVWSGDPTFDYSSCDIFEGDEPRCSAVQFRVDNVGLVEIPSSATVEVFADDAGTRSELSAPISLGRPIAVGERDTFTLCWANPLEFREVDFGVLLEGACASVEAATDTTDVDLAECGDEQCDGFDNDADGEADERGEACPLVTQECFYDPALELGYICVNALEAESCETLGCPFGQACDGSICVPNDAETCGSGWCGEDVMSGRFSDDVGSGSTPSDDPSRTGCSAARSGTMPMTWIVSFMLVLSMRRRRQN